MNTANLATAYLMAKVDLLGLKFLYPLRGGRGDLAIEMKVLDKRVAYGRTDLLVEPVAGTGTKWVDVRSLGEVVSASVDLS